MNAIHRLFGRLCTRSQGNGPAKQRLSQAQHKHCVKPNVEQLDERVLPSLTPLSYNAGYPYSAVVQVQVTFPDHHSGAGSGAMIDSFHVLTAAHMLYSAADGGWATSVQVIPDKYYTSAPRGSAHGTSLRVDPSWPAFNQAHPGQSPANKYAVEDIGLITLNSTIGNSTGWFRFGWSSNNNFFTNQYFETAGYPASNGYNGQQMYYSYGRVLSEQADCLVSTEGNITNIPGQSGSPLWYTPSSVIYAVNSGWSGSTASGSEDYFARISQSVFTWILNARASDRVPSGTTALALTSSPATTTAFLGGLGGVRLADAGVVTPATMAGGDVSPFAVSIRAPANTTGGPEFNLPSRPSLDHVFSRMSVDGHNDLLDCTSNALASVFARMEPMDPLAARLV